MRATAGTAWVAAAAACALVQLVSSLAVSGEETGLAPHRETRAARGDEPDHHLEEYHGEPKSTSALNYYEFLINEGSYKFWAWFQLATAALLIYSAFAAIYYSKYTYYTSAQDYDYDYFFRRSGEAARSSQSQSSSFLGLSAQTYQRILDAISSNKYA